jgi:type VI secretion system protein VasG
MVMMRGIVTALEKHHNVRILDDGVHAAVRLSHRYLPDRQLPGQGGQRAGHRLRPPRAGAERDARRARGRAAHRSTTSPCRSACCCASRRRRRPRGAARRDRGAPRRDGGPARRSASARWEQERDLVQKVRDLREQIEDRIAANGSATRFEAPRGAGAARRAERLNDELTALQGETPLIPVTVDAELVGQVISGWTGIPVGKMLRDDLAPRSSWRSTCSARLIGQDHALEIISHRIRTSKAGIEDPQKPIGVFLLVGPSGVGKTETALALSDLLYGGEHNVITINMSEFQEAHTVSTLKGSPPGYVGYGEGGVLTEAVRRRPYSVVLLDEIEKAHPDVLELFFQVFDKGRMEDGEGRQIDFKNCIILLTTNAGTDTLMKLTADPETMPSHEGLVKALKPELDRVFKPAFLGRTVIIPYFPVRDEALKTIIRLKLGKIQRRLRETHRIELVVGRRGGRRHRRALHRGRERRAQRGQHPDQHHAAGDLQAAPRIAGRGHQARSVKAAPTRTEDTHQGDTSLAFMVGWPGRGGARSGVNRGGRSPLHGPTGRTHRTLPGTEWATRARMRSTGRARR